MLWRVFVITIRALCFVAALATVGQAANHTIVQFSSPGCVACQTIQPTIEQLRSEGWIVRYIDTQQDPVTAERFRIRQTPTLVLLEGGREVDRIVGSLPHAELLRRVHGEGPSRASKTVQPEADAYRSADSRAALYGPNHPYFQRKRGQENSLSSSPSVSSLPPNPFKLDRAVPVTQSPGPVTQSPGPVTQSPGPVTQKHEDPRHALLGINHPFYSRPFRGRELKSGASFSNVPAISNRPAEARVVRKPRVDLLPISPSGLPLAPECMESTVRIRVDYGDSSSVGTGTIIHSAGEHVLVLTCGHPFDENMFDEDKNAPITVELFRGGEAIQIPASKVSTTKREGVDLGLIRFRTSVPVKPIRILPSGETLQERDPVFSIGCDLGADPSRRDTIISRLNRFLGASNVEIVGSPIEGRSGGGLFDAQGRLVAVCYAADPDLDEGLYVGPEAIHELLAEVQLSFLFERD